MRITCPRCSAQYEVPDSVMPPGGRDVQCSNCGHSWYQLVSRPAPSAAETGAQVSADGEEAAAELRLRRLRDALDGHKARSGTGPGGRALDLAGAAGTEGAPQAFEATPASVRKSAAEPAGYGHADRMVAGLGDGMEPAPDPAAGPRGDPAPDDGQDPDAPPPRRRLDPAVAAVLRAEAEFERNARAHGPAQALEMQPDLGLVQPRRSRAAETVRDRLARIQAAERTGGSAPLLGGEETYPDPGSLGRSLEPPARTSPRPMPPPPAQGVFTGAGLPVRAQRRDLAIYQARRARRGFRWGFFLSLSACLAAPALYLAAPALAALVPGQAGLFEGIARTGAEIHVALAGAVQDWLLRLGG